MINSKTTPLEPAENLTFLNRIIRIMATTRYFVTHNETRVEVTITESVDGHQAVRVRALHGFPFNMPHGDSGYTFLDGEFWYSEKWVNCSDIEATS